MKRILISFFLGVISLIASAQTESPHMTFKGVPIDGTLKEFTTKMVQKGFTSVGIENGISVLQGDFASYKDCIIGVTSMKQRDLVSKIVVIFPECSTWQALSSNYYTLKVMLTKKYGNPSEETEKFETYSEPRDDNSRLHNVKFDRCKFVTIYETEKGFINLRITHGDSLDCHVSLVYIDKMNGELINEDAMDDL